MSVNSRQVEVFTATIDPASVAAAITAEQTFTVPGVRVGDVVVVTKPTLTAGLGIANARCPGNDQVAITFINATAGAIDAASEVYSFAVFRR